MKFLSNIPVLHPVTLADILFHRGKKRAEAFLALPYEKQLVALRVATPRAKRELMHYLSIRQLLPLLNSIGPDEAADLLQIMTRHKRTIMLKMLSDELKNALSTLLEFDAQTAAGLMTLDYIQVEDTDNVVEVARKFRRHEQKTGRPPAILVMREAQLVGFLPGHELGFVDKDETIGAYVKHVPAISYAATHSDVLHLFRSHPHNKVAVLDDNKAVLGIIYSDDVLKILREENSASLYNFAGINNEESVSDSIRHKVQYRYKWLIINLATSFLAALTVGLFEHTLDTYVLLAIYMPIVAGMGGNAATQTLAVLVRGIALRQIELKTAYRALRNEMGAGFINGAINGVLVAAVVMIFNHDIRIALILAVAMIINLLVAGFFGTLVPLIMARLGKDPASSATIFITTATDVLGFLVFLGLATVVLK
ncbi:MAG TPA: magnesium transporter [Candidatus Saccharimonadales bacterium]